MIHISCTLSFYPHIVLSRLTAANAADAVIFYVNSLHVHSVLPNRPNAPWHRIQTGRGLTNASSLQVHRFSSTCTCASKSTQAAKAATCAHAHYDPLSYVNLVRLGVPSGCCPCHIHLQHPLVCMTTYTHHLPQRPYTHIPTHA
jgi:hypothetical protein